MFPAITKSSSTGSFQSHRRRGTVLLLVVSTLLLMMILATAYIQVTRQGRTGVAVLSEQAALEHVASAVIPSIQFILKEDLGIDSSQSVNASGDENVASTKDDYYFISDKYKHLEVDGKYIPYVIDPKKTLTALRTRKEATAPEPTGSATDPKSDFSFPTDQEPYDYPGPVDQWLASSAPERAGGLLVWRQTSMLGNRYAWPPLDETGKEDPAMRHLQWQIAELLKKNPANHYDTVAAAVDDPNQGSIQATGATAGQPFLPFTEFGVRADADGDGIIDSKFEEAPADTARDMRFYVAVRIIDNSSMININTATAITPNGQLTYNFPDKPASGHPRGYWPTNLDMSRLIAMGPGGTGAVRSELLGDFMKFRFGVFATDPIVKTINNNTATPIGLFTSIPTTSSFPDSGFTQGYNAAYAWYDLARMYGVGSLTDKKLASNKVDPVFIKDSISAADKKRITQYQFGLDNEFELRYRNGLNNPSTRTLVEEYLPATTRTVSVSQANSTNSNSLVLESRFNKVKDVANPADYLLGKGADNEKLPTSLPEARHFMTTISGSMVLDPYSYLQNKPSLDKSKKSTYGVTPKISKKNASGGGTTAVYDPPATVRRYKWDLLTQEGGYTTVPRLDAKTDKSLSVRRKTNGSIIPENERYERIYERINALFRLDNDKDHYVDGLDESWKVNERARMYSLNLVDYIDPDNVPHIRTDDGTDTPDKRWYGGLEALPFVRAVYIQRSYQCEKDDTAVPPKFVWKAESIAKEALPAFSTVAMVVELGNPFNVPITLSNEQADGGKDDERTAKVRLQLMEPRTKTKLSKAYVLGSNKKIKIEPGKVAYIVFKPDNPRAEEDQGGTKIGGDTFFTDMVFPNANNYEEVSSNGFFDKMAIDKNIEVDLSVEGLVMDKNDYKDGDYDVKFHDVTYERFAVGGFALPREDIDDGDGKDSYIGKWAIFQAAAGRVSDGSLYLSNKGKSMLGDKRYPNQYNSVPYRLADYFKLGDDKKIDPSEGQQELRTVTIPCSNAPIMSVAEMGWIFCFSFYDYLDNYGGSDDIYIGDLPHVLDRQFAKQSNLFLVDVFDPKKPNDFDAPKFVKADKEVPPFMRIPNQLLLFDAFTTISPLMDGENNDGQGNADEAAVAKDDGGNRPTFETFIPGTININTAPLTVLALSCPIPEDVTDEVVPLMNSIISYRDNPEKRLAKVTGGSKIRGELYEKGIATMGELMLVNSANGSAKGDMLRYAYDNSLFSNKQKNEKMSLYPMPELDTNNKKEDEPANKKTPTPFDYMARFQYLAQPYTTRSDIYTAYIYIRGYDATQLELAKIKIGKNYNGRPKPEDVLNPAIERRFIAVFDRSSVEGKPDQVRVLGIYRY